jgi:hypothetical protein
MWLIQTYDKSSTSRRRNIRSQIPTRLMVYNISPLAVRLPALLRAMRVSVLNQQYTTTTTISLNYWGSPLKFSA